MSHSLDDDTTMLELPIGSEGPVTTERIKSQARRSFNDLAQRFPFLRSAPETKKRSESFYDAVLDSGAFSWIGVVDEEHPVHGHTLHVYLSELPTEQLGDQQQTGLVNAVKQFGPHAASLRDHFYMQLHLIKQTACPTDQLIEQLESHCGSETLRELVWSRHIIDEPA